MLQCLIVGAGGFVGAVARYLMGMIPIRESAGFPYHTLLINVIGAFCIGLIAAFAAKGEIDPKWVLFLKVGICGGFTTFSTFALETDTLIGNGQYGLAAAYICGSVILSIGAVMLARFFA